MQQFNAVGTTVQIVRDAESQLSFDYDSRLQLRLPNFFDSDLPPQLCPAILVDSDPWLQHRLPHQINSNLNYKKKQFLSTPTHDSDYKLQTSSTPTSHSDTGTQNCSTPNQAAESKSKLYMESLWFLTPTLILRPWWVCLLLEAAWREYKSFRNESDKDYNKLSLLNYIWKRHTSP